MTYCKDKTGLHAFCQEWQLSSLKIYLSNVFSFLFPPTPPQLWVWVDKSCLCTPSISYGDFHQSTSFSYEFSEHPLDIKMKTDMLLSSESSCLVDNHKSRSLPPLRMRSFQGPEPSLTLPQTLRHGAGQTWPDCCEPSLPPPQLSAGVCASLTLAHPAGPFSQQARDASPHILCMAGSMKFDLQGTEPSVGICL